MNTALFEGTTGALGARPEVLEVVPIRYCLYARKSTEQDEQQALSIDSQIKEMMGLATREGLNVVEVKRESHSAKETGQRPVFNEIVQGLGAGRYNGILTWAPDRISRNAGDLGKIVDLMDAGVLEEIRTYGQKFGNNPNEKFLLMILGSQAKLENDNKSINVKRGLKTRAEMGLLPGVAPTGYLNDKRSDHKCEIIIDHLRAPMVKRIFEKVGNERWSGTAVFLWLKNDMNFTTKSGKHLTLSSIYEILKNPFYCGVYEYPKKSGNWYVGKHEPIISRELFQTVREKVLEESRPKKKSREFTFTRLMTCGECGSGITAQEKSKNISDGSIRWYIYYSCTRARDRKCNNPYIREDSVIEQLAGIIDQLDIDELGARHLIEKEVARYNKLRSALLGVKEKDKASNMDVKHYAKYLLEEGTMDEKRELLEQLRGKLVIKNKKITL
jgi:site-specific DNA recombinase